MRGTAGRPEDQGWAPPATVWRGDLGGRGGWADLRRAGDGGPMALGPPSWLAPYLHGHGRPTAAPWAGCWGWGSGRRGQRAGAPGFHGTRLRAPSRWPQSCPRRPRLQREGARRGPRPHPVPPPPPVFPQPPPPHGGPAPVGGGGGGGGGSKKPPPPHPAPWTQDRPGSTQPDPGLEKTAGGDPGASRAPNRLSRRVAIPRPR